MEIAQFIDHTLLKPDSLVEDIYRLSQEALHHNFAAVCIPPYFIASAHEVLAGSPVGIATVIGFPLGYSSTKEKVLAINEAQKKGATELDVVINIAAVKNGNWAWVENDLKSMRNAIASDHLIKVILETSLLSELERIRLYKICQSLQVDFVKTSTGFNGGATLEIISEMRAHLPEEIKIKASGGIRSFKQALTLLNAGATRLGTSQGLALIAP